MNNTEKPWIDQQDRRVLVRGRASAELQRGDAKAKKAPKPAPEPPVDPLNQD